MNNDNTNDNRVETSLNLRLEIGFMHSDGDKEKETRNQITRAAFITKSLFRLLELAAVGSETNGVETEYTDHIQNVAILGDALQLSIVESLDQLGIHEREQSADILNSNLLGE